MTGPSLLSSSAPTRFQLYSAAISALIASLVLVGWVLERDALTTVLPGLVAMNPMTAVAILAVSIALAGRSRLPAPLLVSLSVVAVAVGTTKFAQFLLGIDGGIDQLLFADRLDAAVGGIPNRMAPNTAFALAMLGCGVLASGARSHRAIVTAQLLCVVSAAIAAVAAVGYALDVVAFYQVHRYIAMSLPTTVALIILSLAGIGIHPTVGLGRIIADGGPAGTLARTALPIAVLIPLTVGVIDLSAQRAGWYGAESASAIALIANILVNFLLLGGCVVALFSSEEQRRRHQSAIAESEGQYREAERVGRVGYFKIDLATDAVHWSDGFVSICGFHANMPPSIDAIIGACHPDDAPIARAFIEQAGCGNWQFQCRIEQPDGEIRHVRSHGVCLSAEDGTPTAILGVYCDITELELARQAAEAAKETTASFLANMSHEIRTPMNGVMGFVELLLMSDLTDIQRRHLGLVHESAHALLKLLNDILDISKIEAGRVEIAAAPFDVRHGIKQCVRLMTPMAEQKGLELSLEMADEVPSHLLIDGLRLRQILLNLVGNAVKFTDRGSVAVRVSKTHGRSGLAMLQIAVADSGVGIPSDRLTSIFDPFVQAESSITRRFGGSGLGLSISRSLAEMMGGSIRVKSLVGKGTTMTLVIPCAEIEEKAHDRPPAALAPRCQATHDKAGGARILLVEDLDLNRELFGHMLAELGHHFDFAVDGEEACRMAGQLAENPGAWDLVLMDVHMPVMDGLAATRFIRGLGGRAADIPIIALTASAFRDEIEECHLAGMNGHLAKPASIEGLRSIIDRWWAGARSDDALEAKADPAPTRPLVRPARPPRAELVRKFAGRREQTRERLALIISELTSADATQQALLTGEARQLAHFLTGCAGMFDEPELGELALATERRLAGAGSRRALPPAAVRRVLQSLLAALDTPQFGGAERLQA